MFDEKFTKTNFIMVFIYLKKSILSLQNVKACMQYALSDAVIDVRWQKLVGFLPHPTFLLTIIS